MRNQFLGLHEEQVHMGTVLFDMITGTTETSLDAITFAAREGFLKKAVRASSILANVRSNGVRISRRTPAKTKAVITNPTIEEIYISAYDTFNVNGTSFYCRESFTLKGGESIEITIYEGIPQTRQIILNTLNQDYPKILLDAPGFIVSDTDVKLFVDEGLGNVEMDSN